MFDAQNEVTLLVDEALAREERLLFHPCDNRFTVGLFFLGVAAIGYFAGGVGIAVAVGVAAFLILLIVGWLKRVSTRYSITDDLRWVEEDQVSFASYPLSDNANLFSQYQVDDETMYLPYDGYKRIIWNPRTMEIRISMPWGFSSTSSTVIRA